MEYNKRVNTQSNLKYLTEQFSHAGRLQAIYLRPARGEPCQQVEQATAVAMRGLQGDRSAQKSSSQPLGSKRQVTLIQAEHLLVVSALVGKSVEARLLRRNLVISGLNLLAAKSLFKDQTLYLKIGEVILQVTGPCEPCSKMEIILGRGGYNAMRGHGGVTARVIKGGEIKNGDAVTCVSEI